MLTRVGVVASKRKRDRRCWADRHALPTYRKSRQIFDFAPAAAYNAALSPHYISDESRKTPHGRTFPVQEHHAPQGPAGCPEVETVLEAGPGNHRRGQDGPARSQHEC